ncbi:DUF3606 domain-containing protein [Mesorhizobium sp. M0317]|uniref:DUF3606 domain-containing protein n=1 Tax=unclassified Mesorhizobium TaxID=325217 RepID=UPI0003CF5A29|nr:MULTISPECIES: DUF3606 domain-containing protein [unclassified Mesorhizobium]ESY08889.1 hypothetical protein X752_21410 [Mesorhizobium sp. LNJC398B00]ESY31842.1 hypothetical protein X748_24415 [Mesorhizobium sp. LNJC386A00]
MTDNKSERDFGDRNRVSSNERNEVEHFAQQNGITPEQVMELIKAAGNDRASLTAAAKELKSVSRGGSLTA